MGPVCQRVVITVTCRITGSCQPAPAPWGSRVPWGSPARGRLELVISRLPARRVAPAPPPTAQRPPREAPRRGRGSGVELPPASPGVDSSSPGDLDSHSPARSSQSPKQPRARLYITAPQTAQQSAPLRQRRRYTLLTG